MSRPSKFDRIMKLVVYETGFIPLSVTQEKDKTLVIMFDQNHVTEQDLEKFHSRLKLTIPLPLQVKTGDNDNE